MVKMKLTGMKELERALLDLGKEYGDPKYALQAMRPAMKKAVEPLVDNIKANTPVDDGDLRDSSKFKIRKANTKDKDVFGQDSIIVAEAGWIWAAGKGTYAKALAVEYGTSNKKAQPVLRRALEANAGSMISTFKEELAKSIKKKAKQLAKKSVKK